jgi:hypothetical protein
MHVVLETWPRDQLLAFLEDFCIVRYPALPLGPHAASIHYMSPSFLRWALPKTTMGHCVKHSLFPQKAVGECYPFDCVLMKQHV